MAEVINMPRLSDTMEEGTVTKWFKKIGDQVKEGDILIGINIFLLIFFIYWRRATAPSFKNDYISFFICYSLFYAS